MCIYFLLIKGLTKVYTIRDIKHTKDNPQGIIVIEDVTILSLSVQFDVKVFLKTSIVPVMFDIFIYLVVNNHIFL